jgi:hypothetical protein
MKPTKYQLENVTKNAKGRSFVAVNQIRSAKSTQTSLGEIKSQQENVGKLISGTREAFVPAKDGQAN